MLGSNIMRSHGVAAALDQRRLNLILFPTEKCNFRCTYCYEDFKLGRMHPEVVGAIKLLLSRRIPELECLEVSWFGGEPLLAPNIIEDVSRHILDLAGQHPMMHYDANITTNASLLTAERFAWLHGLGVRHFQVSIDGDKDVHDSTRKGKDGQATFDRIWQNLLAIRETTCQPVRVILRVHFLPANYERLSPLIDRINKEFAADPRFVVYFKSVERLGGPNDKTMKVFSEATASVVKKTLYTRLCAERMAYDIGEDGEYICYATKANSLGIRADGCLVKCTVALYDARNAVGRLRTDGTIQVNREALLLWLQGLETMDSLALACPYSLMKGESDGKCQSVSSRFLHEP
jgi:uncharacterized protein